MSNNPTFIFKHKTEKKNIQSSIWLPQSKEIANNIRVYLQNLYDEQNFQPENLWEKPLNPQKETQNAWAGNFFLST